MFSFSVIIMNKTTVEDYFDDIASSNTRNYYLKLCFEAIKVSTLHQSHYIFG